MVQFANNGVRVDSRFDSRFAVRFAVRFAIRSSICGPIRDSRSASRFAVCDANCGPRRNLRFPVRFAIRTQSDSRFAVRFTIRGPRTRDSRSLSCFAFYFFVAFRVFRPIRESRFAVRFAVQFAIRGPRCDSRSASQIAVCVAICGSRFDSRFARSPIRDSQSDSRFAVRVLAIRVLCRVSRSTSLSRFAFFVAICSP